MAYVKTIWIDNSEPKINATNLNHIENGIKNNEISINNTKGFILWENENPSSDISTDTEITLNSNDYDMYEIVCEYNTTNQFQLSTKARKGTGVIFFAVTPNFNTRRTITYVDDTHLVINPALNQADNMLIPLYVIGYKTGLFEE